MRLRTLALLLSLGIAACPEPKEYDGLIAVAPGNRLALLPSSRHPDAGAPTPAASSSVPPASPAARVHPMRAGGELRGAKASGREGDLVLENDEVVFVLSGGVVDAADAKGRVDALDAFVPDGAVSFDAPTSGVDASGKAWAQIESRSAEGLVFVTRYELAPPDRAMLVTTTVKNPTDVRRHVALGDRVRWGDAEPFVAGRGFGFRDRATVPFVAGIADATSYALTSTDFELAIAQRADETRTEQGAADIAPGGAERWQRVFLVGPRGDVASVVSELTRAMGQPVGVVEIGLRDGQGAAIAVPDDAKVLVSTPKEANVMSVRPARPNPGTLAAELPVGSYLLAWGAGGGREGKGAPVAIEVKADATTRAELRLAAPRDAGRD